MEVLVQVVDRVTLAIELAVVTWLGVAAITVVVAMKVTLSADSDTPILCLALANALESFQCLYSVYLETAFPLQRSQGQWAWAYGKAAQNQYETGFLLQPPSMQYA